MSNSRRHLDLIEIELVRTGEGDPGAVEHVAACSACGTELAALEELATVVSTSADSIPIIPTEVEQRILWNARKRAALARRARVRTGGWSRWNWAAAAVVLLALGVGGVWRFGADDLSGGTRSATANDIDGNGRVDILDALALATSLEAGVASTDVNGDGNVDARDVDTLARIAVRLEPV